MQFFKTPVALTLLGMATLSTCALAQHASWYMGTSVGQSMATIDDARINSTLLGAGFSSTSIADRNRDTGYKLFGGYQINPNFAIEGGYFNLGQFGYTATTVPAGSLTGDIKVQGLNLDLVGTVPVTGRFSLLGRIGANYAEVNGTFSKAGAMQAFNVNPNPNSRETNLKLGLGMEYAVTESLSWRAEVERYRINDAVTNKGDVDLVSLGLVYRFGAKTPPPVQRAPEPAWVAPVAVVKPPPPVVVPRAPSVPVPVPVPVPLKKMTFSTDAFFDFNQKDMKPSGKAALDKLAEELRDANYDKITITGHTDRIGTHAYNVKLSTERAEAVKAYLVASTAIPAEKIVTIGDNGSEPVTKPGECVGTKATKALVTCLAPDRRVDIEVIGTK
jgi:OmpA-OmpF porin, OOP family